MRLSPIKDLIEMGALQGINEAIEHGDAGGTRKKTGLMRRKQRRGKGSIWGRTE